MGKIRRLQHDDGRLRPGFPMSSQASSDDEGQGEVSGGDAGLDAKLDRAVPSGEAIAFLVAVAGDQPGRVYPVDRNTVILGRTEEADICISDPSVSARHARIVNWSHGVEIEDLDSTNGTFVGGQRVTRARLKNGDRVALGTAEFNFLIERSVEATVALMPPGRWISTATPGALVRMPESRHFPPPPLPVARVDVEDADASFADFVRRLVVAYQFLRRYALLIVILAAGATIVGFGSIFVVPPALSAGCEIRLRPQLKVNPVDNDRTPDDSLQFFGGPERAFTNPELVRLTVRQLGESDPDDSGVASVRGRLKFESLDEPHLYRATYKESVIGAKAVGAVQFLTAHVQNYVQSEITKALKVFTAEAEFLRNQMKSVEKDLSEIASERTKFRQANADRLPEEAVQTHSSRFQLESRRAELTAQVRRLQGELDSARRQLASEGPLAQSKFQSSQVYRQSLATINQKLTEALARGLAEGHPEVRQLNDEKRRIEGLIETEMHAETSAIDRQSSSGLQAMQNRVESLQGQLGAARSDLGDTLRSLGQVRHLVGDLPRVEERVRELSHKQDATNRLHTQLFEKLKKAELQLSLERVSAESRYEMVTPPRLDNRGRAKYAALRGGIGMFSGLLLAALVILFREGRRMFSRTLATLESQDRSWR